MAAFSRARGGSWAATAIVPLVAAILLLLVAGCGSANPAAASGPTPTTPPNATRCAQVYGFAHATALSIPGLQFPPGTVAIPDGTTRGATVLTISAYRVCTPNGALSANPYADPVASNGGVGVGSGATVFSQVFGGDWQDASSFPADGRHLTTCDTGAPNGYPVQQCALLPPLVYAMIDQATAQGKGLVVFRLRLARPPHPCDTNVYAPVLTGSDGGYAMAVAPLAPLDQTQVPLPPLSVYGVVAVGFQPVVINGLPGQVPYATLPVCTQGTRASILADMSAALLAAGWTQTSADGTAWAKQIPGGWRLELRLTGLDTPQNWTILMGPRLDLPPPPSPTPQPSADAACSTVPGLQHATAIAISDVKLPQEVIGIATTTASGAGKYTVVDYYLCAPDFELTANPQFGSGGYPLGEILPQTYWDDAGSFPFDGVNFQPCQVRAVGYYLDQLCRSHGTARYAIEQQIAEPGRGLVTFHLLIATASQ